MEKSICLVIIAFLMQTYVVSNQHEKKLSFIAIGDFGGLPVIPYTTHTQKTIASAVGKLAKKTNARFIVGLGDNFYFDGVKTVTDPRFSETFESVYTHPSLKHPNCRWYMIAGNHDHHGNVSAQIAYTKLSKRWHFPSYFYTRIEKIPNTSMTLQLVMIDTTLLLGAGKHKKSEPKAKEQMSWIRKTLKDSVADYLVVAGHHPILSAGEHGPTSHARMKKLQTMFEQNNVTAYICGHDHNMQHLKEKRSNMHYVVAGSGNFVNPGKRHIHSIPKGSLKYFYGHTGGFAHFEAKPKKLRVHFMTIHYGWGLLRTYTSRILPRLVKRVEPVFNQSQLGNGKTSVKDSLTSVH